MDGVGAWAGYADEGGVVVPAFYPSAVITGPLSSSCSDANAAMKNARLTFMLPVQARHCPRMELPDGVGHRGCRRRGPGRRPI